ncbi:flagellar hook-associated protein FlgL [Vibrio sp. SS-MA-C1-2]|uniref:flagellar hook-associated protein FlgL n=1 Tax=Vibrio sp. SS-MA-C1-2 TaxID=2908646 RepID=UPI001F3EE9D1|nr:flagellar hook-associated protein FlgL [Vibrio sp. SS-MA-C1-2]UJF18026.1 flagellar hook-associated protein FlgL [Vibrio sp. SS-MA-C1-2]
MRVTDSQFNNLMHTSLQKNNVALNKVFEQLSTGKKINHLSDDPIASIKLQGLSQSISKGNQYERNIQNVTSKMQQYETYLSTAESISQSVNELLLQGKNGTLDVNSREGIVIELESYKDELIEIFNKQDQGNFIFGGTAIDQQPITVATGPTSYTFYNNSDKRLTSISEGKSVENNITAVEVLGTDPANNIFTQLDTVIAEFSSATPNYTNVDNAINANQDFHGRVLSTITKIGSEISGLERYSETTQDTILFAQVMENDLVELDFAEASIRLNQGMLALEATQKSYMRISGANLFSLL